MTHTTTLGSCWLEWRGCGWCVGGVHCSRLSLTTVVLLQRSTPTRITADCIHSVIRPSPCAFIHRVSKNVSPLACYNFDAREWILIFFGRNVTDKVGNQNTLYYATSNNLCFCTTCQNGETWKSHFSLTHNAPVNCLLKEKIVICDVFDSV